MSRAMATALATAIIGTLPAFTLRREDRVVRAPVRLTGAAACAIRAIAAQVQT
jgi:hypothetical protein